MPLAKLAEDSRRLPANAERDVAGGMFDWRNDVRRAHLLHCHGSRYRVSVHRGWRRYWP
jgi:hypothetical protein